MIRTRLANFSSLAASSGRFGSLDAVSNSVLNNNFFSLTQCLNDIIDTLQKVLQGKRVSNPKGKNKEGKILLYKEIFSGKSEWRSQEVRLSAISGYAFLAAAAAPVRLWRSNGGVGKMTPQPPFN